MSDRINPSTPGHRPEQGGTQTGTSSSTGGSMGTEDLRAAARQASDRVAGEASAAADSLKREGAAVLDEARNRAEGLAQEGVRTGAEQAGSVARAVHRAADELESENPALARTIHEAAGALDGMARQLRDRSPGELLRGAEDFARRQPLAFFGIAALAGFAVARFAKSSSPDRYAGTQHGSRAYPGQGMYGGDAMRHGEGRYPAAGMGSGMGGGTQPTRDTMHDMRTAGTSGTGPVSGASPGGPGDVPGVAAPGWVKDESGTPKPATLASASLGGAAAHRPRTTDES